MVGRPAFQIHTPGVPGKAICFVDFEMGKNCYVNIENTLDKFHVNCDHSIQGATLLIQLAIHNKI